MNDVNDFDVSQLRWWRYIAVDSNDKIQTFVVKIETNNIYMEFGKIRQSLESKGLRFIEAKPITQEEVLAAEKVARFKLRRQKQLRELTGRRYSPLSHWPAVLYAALLFLLILLLVRLH